MSTLQISGHYPSQALNVAKGNDSSMQFWVNPPNTLHQPLPLTIHKDEAPVLHALLSEALAEPHKLPYWQSALTSPAIFRQSYSFTIHGDTVMFEFCPNSLDITVYRSTHPQHRDHLHLTAIAGKLAHGFITDLGHALFLASAAQQQPSTA